MNPQKMKAVIQRLVIEQLSRIMGEVFEQFDSVCEKYVKIEDFYTELESMGIKVTK